uniref:Uncharacterized protein n=1 Tax=Acrobeloides nanus TaxID=290746 RepID=A0A914CCT5_9BILA
MNYEETSPQYSPKSTYFPAHTPITIPIRPENNQGSSTEAQEIKEFASKEIIIGSLIYGIVMFFCIAVFVLFFQYL